MRLGQRIPRHVVLAIVSALFLVPFYVILISAFKRHGDIVGDPLGVGEGLELDNFNAAFSDQTFNVAGSFLVSAVLSVSVVALVIVFGGGLAYVISRRGGRWRAVYVVLLLGLTVPAQVVLIPVVKVLVTFGLMGTIGGLIVYYVGTYLPFAIFIYVAALNSIPRALDEAAAIDGAGLITTYYRVVFPLLRPSTVTVATIITIFVWNDYVGPQVILSNSPITTATTGLVRAVGVLTNDWGLVFAFVVLVSAPVVVLYIAAQRFIVGGLTGGINK